MHHLAIHAPLKYNSWSFWNTNGGKICGHHHQIVQRARGMYPRFFFEITHRSPKSQARGGRLVTPHGVVSTPNFIFCGTKGTMKAITTEQLEAVGAEIMFSNTYYLCLQLGADTIAENIGLYGMIG
jgi:hypothetical protein